MPNIITTMELLKYSPNKQGVRFGIATMVLQATLHKDATTFASRMNSIRNASVEDIETHHTLFLPTIMLSLKEVLIHQNISKIQ